MKKFDVQDENNRILIQAFKPKEDEMREGIREYWNNQVDKFLAESEYFSPSEYLSRQLGRRYDWKHPVYTLGCIGIFKFDAIRKNETNYCNRTEPKETLDSNNKRNLEKYVTEQGDLAVEASRQKLLKSIYKFIGEEKIEKLTVVNIDNYTGYLEGCFEIITNEKVHLITTKGIYAGGYNIQRFHIRYLSKEA